MSDLVEENASIKAAHARDVGSLEAMLKQLCDERDRLHAENRALAAEAAALRAEEQGGCGQIDAKWKDLSTSRSTIALSEYAPSRATVEEPEEEHFGEFDIRACRLEAAAGTAINDGPSPWR